MKVWHPRDILRALFSRPEDASDAARRWWRAAQADPELLKDVLRLGGILTLQPHDAAREPAPIDPYRLAYDAGRRDMALQLSALMGLTIHELNTLVTEIDHEAYPRR